MKFTRWISQSIYLVLFDCQSFGVLNLRRGEGNVLISKQEQTFTFSESYSKKSFPFGTEVMASLMNHEGWWVGDWDGLKLESFPNCFLWIGMHSKIYGVCPKLIPKKVKYNFATYIIIMEWYLGRVWIEWYLGRVVKRCPWPPMCGNEATTVPVAPIAPNVSVIKGFFFLLLFDDQRCKKLENTM